MTFAIDFDGVWASDPALFRLFVDLLEARGHQAIMVTGRSDVSPWADEVRRGEQAHDLLAGKKSTMSKNVFCAGENEYEVRVGGEVRRVTGWPDAIEARNEMLRLQIVGVLAVADMRLHEPQIDAMADAVMEVIRPYLAD